MRLFCLSIKFGDTSVDGYYILKENFPLLSSLAGRVLPLVKGKWENGRSHI